MKHLSKVFYVLLVIIVIISFFNIPWYHNFFDKFRTEGFIAQYFQRVQRSKERQECESKGMEYRYYNYGLSGSEICVKKVTDGGMSCQSGSKCQSGYCFITEDAKVDQDGRYTGRCADTGETNFCNFAELENGAITKDMRGNICN